MQKVPKLYRIRYNHIMPEHGKRYLPNASPIFNQRVEVSEKIDGSQIGLSFKSGQPYLQSKNSHLPMNGKHPAFSGAWSWVWDNIETVEKLKGYTIFSEWTKVMHTVPYDNLPDWLIVFDCWIHSQKRFMCRSELSKFTTKVGLTMVPTIYEGKLKYNDIPNLIENKKPNWSTSRYLNELTFNDSEIERIKNAVYSGQPVVRFENGTINMEGCVIKPQQNPKTMVVGKETVVWSNAGKVVVNAFLDETIADADWMHEGRQRFNRLAEWNK